MKLSVGDKIIATNTSENLGFRKGDEILILRKSKIFDNALIGKNLTRPDCYGNSLGAVWIEDYIEYEFENEETTVSVFKFKFFKWTITIKEIRD